MGSRTYGNKKSHSYIKRRSKIHRQKHLYRKPHPKAKVPDWSGLSYFSRGYCLQYIGFSTYRAYLKSELYDAIRRRVFAQRGAQCTLCPKRANELHHNRYSINVLLGKADHEIHPVCYDCHRCLEFDWRDKKRELHEAAEEFHRRRRIFKESQLPTPVP